MKYIILNEMEIEVAVLFDELLTHDQVAGGRAAVSAGFCNAEGTAWGQSVGLRLKARPQDTAIIQASMARRT